VRSSELDCEVLIIGAGPAGTVAAAFLKQRGIDVRIAERHVAPRFVIGESLLPHGLDVLEQAGLLAAVEARGYERKHGAAFFRGEEHCRFDFGEQFSAGFDHAYQVLRSDFDQTLADAVSAQGVSICTGQSVCAVDFDAAGGLHTVSLESAGGLVSKLSCRFVIDASGYGRVLARLLELERPSDLPSRRALFGHFEGEAPPEGIGQGDIWITKHPVGELWSWIIPFGGGRCSVGAVGADVDFESFPEEHDDCLRGILQSAPSTAKRLATAQPVMGARQISGYSKEVSQLHGPGFCLIGNAGPFLDPVFSSGVTLALESARCAASLVADELGGAEVDWEAGLSQPIARGVRAFRSYIDAWYDGRFASLLFSARQDEAIRRKICSILAGYVWDEKNSFATQSKRKLRQLVELARKG